MKEVYRYGLKVGQLLQLFLFVVHLSYGQAARSPELLTIRLRNTADGGLRNVLFNGGLPMIVTGLHKGYSWSEKEKVIHRFLPREVSKLLIYYTWLVLPFWESLQANAGLVNSLLPHNIMWSVRVDSFERDIGCGSDDERSNTETVPTQMPDVAQTG